MSSRKLFSIFSKPYTINFSSFDHTIPVPAKNFTEKKGAPAKSLRMALGALNAITGTGIVCSKLEKFMV